MRTKTISKHFYDDEIKGVINIDGKRVIYLKPHVKRLYRYDDHLLEDEMDHLNKKVINTKRLEIFLKRVVGIDDFEEN